MIKFSFEHRFRFKKSPAAVWRILEIGVSKIWEEYEGVITVIRREIDDGLD